MKSKTTIVIAILLTLLVCLIVFSRLDFETLPLLPPPLAITPEEYKIYRHVIEAYFFPEESQRVILIWRKTRSRNGPGIEDPPEIEEATLLDYTQKNRKPCLLENRFDLEWETALIDENALERKRPSGMIDWTQFSQRFPRSTGFIAFSRIGFNRKKTQAMIYYERRCGLKCGWGALVYLEKKPLFFNVWRIVKKRTLWMT